MMPPRPEAAFFCLASLSGLGSLAIRACVTTAIQYAAPLPQKSGASPVPLRLLWQAVALLSWLFS